MSNYPCASLTSYADLRTAQDKTLLCHGQGTEWLGETVAGRARGADFTAGFAHLHHQQKQRLSTDFRFSLRRRPCKTSKWSFGELRPCHHVPNPQHSIRSLAIPRYHSPEYVFYTNQPPLTLSKGKTNTNPQHTGEHTPPTTPP